MTEWTTLSKLNALAIASGLAFGTWMGSGLHSLSSPLESRQRNAILRVVTRGAEQLDCPVTRNTQFRTAVIIASDGAPISGGTDQIRGSNEAGAARCIQTAIESWRFDPLSGNDFLKVEFEINAPEPHRGQIGLSANVPIAITQGSPSWEVLGIDGSRISKSASADALNSAMPDLLSCFYRYAFKTSGVDMTPIRLAFDVTPEGTVLPPHYKRDDSKPWLGGGTFPSCANAVIQALHFDPKPAKITGIHTEISFNLR